MKALLILVAAVALFGISGARADHGQVAWNSHGVLTKTVVTNVAGKFGPAGENLEADLLLSVGYWNESPHIQLTVKYVDNCPGKAGSNIVVCVGSTYNGGDYTQLTYRGSRIGAAWVQIDQSAYVVPIDGHTEWRFCHELGHALGLAHPEPYNDSCISQGWRPNQHDFDELALMYGG